MAAVVFSALPFVVSVIVVQDLGNDPSITLQYPQPLGEANESLISYIWSPEQTDSSVFYLGRDSKMTEKVEIKQEKKKTDDPTVEVYVYEFNPDGGKGGWELKEGIKSAVLHRNSIEILDDVDNSLVTEIKMHSELVYTEPEPRYVAVLTEDGTVLGFRFKSKSDEDSFLSTLERMCVEFETSSKTHSPVSYSKYDGPLLRCFSVKKGSIAIAFCSGLAHPEIFRPAIEIMIEELKSSEDFGVTISRALDQINQWKFANSLSFNITKKFPIFNRETKLPFFEQISPDQPCSASLLLLIQTFGEKIMTIFNGVLSNQRVLFVTRKRSHETICKFVVAAALTVSPYKGFFDTNVFPFTHIHTQFYRMSGYIAGVADEDLFHQKELWDVLCNIDNGSVTINPQCGSFTDEDSSSLDDSVFREISFASCSWDADREIQKILRKYSRRIMDIALLVSFVVEKNPNPEEVEENKWRAGLWKASSLYDHFLAWKSANYVGDQAESISSALQKLSYCKVISEEEFIQILSLLNSITKEDQKRALVRLIQDYEVFDTIAAGLLHTSSKLRQLSSQCCTNLGLKKMINPFFDSIITSLNATTND